MKITVRTFGLKEAEKALLELKTATAKAIARRTLMKAGEPIQRKAIEVAPDDPITVKNDLKSNILIGTRLNKNQQKALRKSGSSKNQVEVYVGVASRAPQGVFQEFGTVKHGAQPFMRPAWDAEKENALQIIEEEIWTQIEATAKRAAKRAG